MVRLTTMECFRSRLGEFLIRLGGSQIARKRVRAITPQCDSVSVASLVGIAPTVFDEVGPVGVLAQIRPAARQIR